MACEIRSLQTRNKYLDQICADNQSLHDRVEESLNGHERESNVLKLSSEAAATIDKPAITVRPGTTIGRYHLREQIGGCIGIVFVAERQRPIQRKIALKVIKPGMDTRASIARFEGERQSLAIMDHPNIVKVLDAGATESGRPYSVMELVRGVPITEYCDHNRLTVHERLKLFIQVSRATQYAHEKGVMHEGLRPSKILVTQCGGRPLESRSEINLLKSANRSSALAASVSRRVSNCS